MAVDEAPARQGGGELHPETSQVDVDEAVALPIAASPDRQIKVLARHDTVGVVGELGEQLELPNGEYERPSVNERRVIRGPDLQPPGVDRRWVPADHRCCQRRGGCAVLAFHGLPDSPGARASALRSSEFL